MKKFQPSRDAASDFRDIWTYIAADSVKSARKVRLNLFDACNRLAGNPNIGHTRKDLTDLPLLFWPAGSYLIVYDPSSNPLSSARILHGARDFPRILARN